MKTRRNHRKTTTSRRRRRVVKQQRVQTRIHRRKGTTVSSGRRDYFFKRGGGKEDEVINTILQDILDDFKTKYANLFKINKDDVPLQFDTDNANPPKNIISKNPIYKTRDGIKFMFCIVEPKVNDSLQCVYIYIEDSTGNYQLYKKIILVNTSATINDKFKGSYHRDVANIIFNALNALKP